MTAVLGHGRWIVDAIPAITPFGVVWSWTIEDHDEHDGDVVAAGRALDVVSGQLESQTALLGLNGLARQPRQCDHVSPGCPHEVVELA